MKNILLRVEYPSKATQDEFIIQETVPIKTPFHKRIRMLKFGVDSNDFLNGGRELSDDEI